MQKIEKGRMMAENTTIEWATHTFNPWIGCTKISPACDNCYAANFGNTLLPSNVWLGATICNQEEADRDIPKLLDIPAGKRFVSIEPMLGAIDLRMVTDYRAQIDWVICGGESGKNARPMLIK